MRVAIASGKGGTGKTTVAVSLALALTAQAQTVQLLDCDVEEPNAGLFLKPAWTAVRRAYVPVPRVDERACSRCGKCQDACQFNARVISADGLFFLQEMCHSCGACAQACPTRAIREVRRTIGNIREGAARGVVTVEGRLTPGEAKSPPLIKQVKQHAWTEGAVIVDCPPGTSCPTIEAVKGADFCLLVSEATPFGLHDLAAAADMVALLGVPMGVVINRYDLGNDQVSQFCDTRDIPILMCLPYDPDLASAYSMGVPAADLSAEWMARFATLRERLLRMAGKRKLAVRTS